MTLRNKEPSSFANKQLCGCSKRLKDYHQIARIFRVRAKQPGEKGDSLNLPCNIEHAQPVKAGYIVIGDVCAFCYCNWSGVAVYKI